MRRRAVVLAVLSLIACTADLPTEPITVVEGAAFRAALVPLPAPPPSLSGGLEGGDGFPGSIQLGTYETPVLAKITVSGLLDYEGQGGYLPGSGQIDAAGLFIPNQCALLVQVRMQTSSGGAVVGGPVTCPSQPRQIDSYTRYSVVNGQLSAYRTAGPPGSCWKYAPPCIHISGTQTIEITPEEGTLRLTTNKTAVAPGGGIYVTAKGVWAADGTTLVPFVVREWRWEGSGPEVGGGHTKVCAVYNPGQCIVQVYQSGRVVLEALVNGKVKTQSVEIGVIGGDTLPLPPVDSIPTDTIPTDSIPGGGGGGGGSDSVVVEIELSNHEILPLITRRRFDAVTQETFTLNLLSGERENDRTVVRPDTLTVRVNTKWKSTGNPVVGAIIEVLTVPVDSSGGHIHSGSVPRPTGSFFMAEENNQVPSPGPHRSRITVTTGADGIAATRYRSSGIGGRERLIAHLISPGLARSDTAVLTVRVPGLVEMDESMNERYVFNPQDPALPGQQHGNNNRWIIPSFRDSVLEVFDDYFVLGGMIPDDASDGRFVITDVGLEFGGLYDYHRDSEWRSPHMTHRIGNDMDVRSRNLNAAQRDIVTRACRTDAKRRPARSTPRVQRCTFENSPVHLHIEGQIQ